jgi:glutaredoxin
MIELYSKPNCPYCDQAKMLLRQRGKDFIEYKLNEDFTREILLDKFPEAKTYPIIVVDGFNIGGYDQLREHFNKEHSSTAKLLVEQNYFGA